MFYPEIQIISIKQTSIKMIDILRQLKKIYYR